MLKSNLKNRTIPLHYAHAMLEAYPYYLVRKVEVGRIRAAKDKEERLEAKKRKAEQDAEDAKYDIVTETHSYGGKGGTIKVKHKVLKTNQWDASA